MNEIIILKGKCDPYAVLQRRAAEKYNNTEIVRTKKGKPYFRDIPDLFFNISHTDGLTVVAVAESEVGVDAEKLREVDLRIAKRRFLQAEKDYILKADQNRRFFEIWTKKEAYLKYKGTGISGGLSSVNVFECVPKIKTFYYEDYVISVCCENELEIKK